MINLILFVIAIMLLGLYLNRNITRGLTEADKIAEAIRRGEMDTPIPHIRHDNIGRLMYSLAEMRNALIQAFKDKQAEAQATQDDMAQKITQQQKESSWVQSFESGIQHVGQHIHHTTQEITTISEQMSQTSNALAQHSESAQEETEQVLAHIIHAAEETGNISLTLNQITQQSIDIAHQSETALNSTQETAKRMASLQLSSENIGDVVAIIHDIAKKTNLLALNASIEAARAGDAGRGFNVVANEVKSLAQKTALSTENIAQQVANIQAESRYATEASQHIAQTIEQMHHHIESVTHTLEENCDTARSVSDRAQQASQGMQIIQETFSTVAKSAKESDDLASQLANCSHDMQQVSDEQNQLIDQFLTVIQRSRSHSPEHHNHDELF